MSIETKERINIAKKIGASIFSNSAKTVCLGCGKKTAFFYLDISSHPNPMKGWKCEKCRSYGSLTDFLSKRERQTIHYFVDTETSGLFPEKNALLEISIIKHINGKEVDRFYSKIHPCHTDILNPKALEVNGLNPKEWKRGEFLAPFPAAKAIQEFIHIPPKSSGATCYLIAHNISFDAGFIKALGEKIKVPIKLPFFQIDTVQLVNMFLVPMGIKNAKMDTVREFLGRDSKGAHTAEKDCEDLVWLYKLLTPSFENPSLSMCETALELQETIK